MNNMGQSILPLCYTYDSMWGDSMGSEKNKYDIVRNIHSIESLKVNLLAGITKVFDGLHKGKEEQVFEFIANIMVSLYCLSKRMGYSYRKIDQKLQETVSALENNQNNEFADDIRELKQYLKVRGE